MFPPDAAQKCRSAQKSNVLGGDLIKCFQTSGKRGGEQKKKAISSGRVQVWGSNFRDPWNSFVVRPLTHSLKSYPRDLIRSGGVGSQHGPSLFRGVHLSQREPAAKPENPVVILRHKAS